MTTAHAAPGVIPERIPSPEEPVPDVAWPTVALLVVGLLLFGGSSALAVTDTWPLWASILPNAVAMYLMFTVAHDASHGSSAARKRVDDVLGQVAVPFFLPVAGLRTWRWLHMQHHNHTNDIERDPDAALQSGRAPAVLRWMFGDVLQLAFYRRAFGGRPKAERRGFVLSAVFAVAVATAAVLTGHVAEYLVLYLMANRLTVVYIIWTFDYLPHAGLDHTPRQNRFQATRLRVGHERWLTPVMLYQNYHLVHHLHPRVPFYRYLAVWTRNQREYLRRDPALVDLRGRTLTAEEYEQISQLAHEHR